MNDKTKKTFKIVCIVVLVCSFLYLGAKGTYTAYETILGVDVSQKIAKFKLLVNGVDVSEENILIDDIEWTSQHTREKKLSPGSCGEFQLSLDPSESDVAMLYSFEFTDKSVDPDRLILFSSVTSSNSTIIRTGVNEYSGIITKAQLSTNPIITIEFCYPDEDDQEPITEDDGDLDDFFEIDFNVYQYLGETLVPYTGS